MKKIPALNPAPPPVSKRPRCGNCKNPLRPVIDRETIADPDMPGYVPKIISRGWTGRYHGYGDFCSLSCCRIFANAAYKAGYRRRK